MLGWLLVERIRDGHATSLGAASGVVAGLVAITPSCATVSPLGALVVGVLAGAGCALAVGLKYRFGFDDSLDVVGVHMVGGLIGTLLIGFLADATNSPTAAAGLTQNDGLFFGGGFTQLVAQIEGAFAVLIYSFVVTFIIGWVLHKVMGFTVSEDDEANGIDLLEHAETAYELSSFGGGSARSVLAARTAPLEPADTKSAATGATTKEGASA
jgi:Amt family ammonium transporter